MRRKGRWPNFRVFWWMRAAIHLQELNKIVHGKDRDSLDFSEEQQMSLVPGNNVIRLSLHRYVDEFIVLGIRRQEMFLSRNNHFCLRSNPIHEIFSFISRKIGCKFTPSNNIDKFIQRFTGKKESPRFEMRGQPILPGSPCLSEMPIYRHSYR